MLTHRLVAASASTVASVWLTGCFHEDGLVDTADGFGGGWTKSQVLRIMKDSRIGTYGSVILCLYLVTKIQLLALLGVSAWHWGACSGGAPALVGVHGDAMMLVCGCGGDVGGMFMMG